jgi:hypothetical protein
LPAFFLFIYIEEFVLVKSKFNPIVVDAKLIINYAIHNPTFVDMGTNVFNYSISVRK